MKMIKYFAALMGILLSVSVMAQPVARPSIIDAVSNQWFKINYTNVFPVGAVGAVSTTNISDLNGTNAWSAIVDIPQGRGVSFFASMGTTNAGTAGVVSFIFAFSQDTTNWTVGTNIQCQATLSGTALRTAFTNMAPPGLDNIRQVRLRQIDNGNTNITFITNMYWGVVR